VTPKQREVLSLVEEHLRREGVPPTLQELADRLRVSKVTVLNHLKRLEKSKHIRRGYYRRRGIEVLAPTRRLPVTGRIAAGRPIEAVAHPADLDLASTLRPGKDYFVLEVRGDSMIEDQIRDGDYVIVERASTARDGETVVALLEGGEATLKRIYRENGRIRLQPANAAMAPIYADKVEVQGVVVGVYRRL
jgi:repressor LexA